MNVLFIINIILEENMEHIVFGILAQVDAGKTTLSESLLFSAGAIKKAGRVDKKSAFLDNYELERERGITIFSKQAEFSAYGKNFTLLDTPGHVDFSVEMERVHFGYKCFCRRSITGICYLEAA